MGISSFIPGVAQAKLALGVGIIVAFGLMSFHIWRQENKIDGQSKTIATQAVQIVGFEFQKILTDTTFELTKEKDEAVQREKAKRDVQRQYYENKSNATREARRKLSLQMPFSSGLDISNRLAHIMCKIENSADPDAYKACSRGTIDESTLGINHPIVFSSGTAADYARMCEADKDRYEEIEEEPFYSDFCNWVVVGFTKDGYDNLEIWLNRLADNVISDKQTIQQYKEIVAVINNMDQLVTEKGKD